MSEKKRTAAQQRAYNAVVREWLKWLSGGTNLVAEKALIARGLGLTNNEVMHVAFRDAKAKRATDQKRR